MHTMSTQHSTDFGRLRLHGLALLSGLALVGSLLFPWITFVQLVLKHKILTGVFFVVALLALEGSGYFLIRAVRERAVTLWEALAPLFYSAAGVLSAIFGYFYILPINPVATVYLLGAAGLAVGTPVLWPQSPQIRALLNGRTFRYSALGAIAFTLIAGAWLFSLGWAQRPVNPPSAAFVVSSQTTRVGEPIDFDASASSARQGQLKIFDWDFGDGIWHEAPAPHGAKTTHVYYEPGQYEVMLRVTDDRGEVSPAYSLVITVQGESGLENVMLLPAQDIAGMAWDGSRLWLVDSKSKVLYSQAEGSSWVQHTLPTEIQQPAGIEWDGQSFWLADGATMIIYKLSKENFEILSQWAYPGTIPADLAWDGKYLWAVDEIDSLLYALDPASGRTVKEIKLDAAIFPRPVGLAWDGIALWVSDMHYGIRRIDSESGRVLGTMAAPEGGSYPIALAWDSGSQGYGRLLVADHDTRKLYTLKLKAWGREKPGLGEGVNP